MALIKNPSPGKCDEEMSGQASDLLSPGGAWNLRELLPVRDLSESCSITHEKRE